MMIDSENIFENIEVSNKSIVYLSTGAAANIESFNQKLKHEDFKIGNNNHQFPPFLFNFYN